MLFRVKLPDEANISAISLKVWHERLGHANLKTLKDMIKKGCVNGVKLTDTDDFFCDAYQIGKSHRQAFKQQGEKRIPKPGEFFHTDVCGPMSTESLGGARYFVLFKDDASAFRLIYFLKHKSDVIEKFKEIERLVAKKFGQTMKYLRDDNGWEYCSAAMREYLKKRGIQLEFTAPFTPEQNGKSERGNRTIVESARTMLLSKDLFLQLWAEAVNTAVYVLNRTTCLKIAETTPYEIWNEREISGSTAYVHIPKQLRKKLEAKAKKLIFVGY